MTAVNASMILRALILFHYIEEGLYLLRPYYITTDTTKDT